MAASTEEKEARGDFDEDSDDDQDLEDEESDTDENEEEEGRYRHKHANKRSSTHRGCGTEGAYAYERVEGTMEQLESWNGMELDISFIGIVH